MPIDSDDPCIVYDNNFDDDYMSWDSDDDDNHHGQNDDDDNHCGQDDDDDDADQGSSRVSLTGVLARCSCTKHPPCDLNKVLWVCVSAGGEGEGGSMQFFISKITHISAAVGSWAGGALKKQYVMGYNLEI